MTTATLDLNALLAQADAAAGAGDWSTAQLQLAQARVLAPHDAGIATGLGISLLRLGRLPDALAEFQHAAMLAPDNAESLNNLGFASALNGQAEAAEAAFIGALECDPDHGAATRNLAQLYLDLNRLQEGVGLLVARVRAVPDDADALHLLGTCYEEVDDLESARALFRQAVAQRPTDPDFQAALARVSPAQPEAVLARPGLSDKLARLKGRNGQTPPAPSKTQPVDAAAVRPIAVTFYGIGETSDATRLGVPANALADLQHHVKLTRTPEVGDLRTFDVFVFSRPHLSGEHMHALKQARAAGKRVIVDVETDTFALPGDHPRRPYLASADALANLELALAQADLVTVASQHLAQALAPRCSSVAVVPSGWSPANAWWTKPGPAHTGVTLGWVGDPSQDLDLLEIADTLHATLRAHPNARIAIAGSPAAYQAFDDVPEARKLFLPMVGPDDFPYLLAHFDVLLAPVRQRGYACVGSDQRLMEAGARALPWIASPAPAYAEWTSGGVFCSTATDWAKALEHALDNDAWRRTASQAGREAAQARRASAIGALWQKLLTDPTAR